MPKSLPLLPGVGLTFRNTNTNTNTHTRTNTNKNTRRVEIGRGRQNGKRGVSFAKILATVARWKYTGNKNTHQLSEKYFVT